MLSAMKPTHARTALLLTAVALFGYGCFERQLRPVNPCTTSNVGRRISIENVDTVDMLIMVDNSNSMSQEQALLRAEIPRIINVLTSGDRDADGTRDFTPVRSMHVGIITSDLGAGNVPAGEVVPSCDPGLGDDGIMRNVSTSSGAGCMANYPRRVFEFVSMTDDPASFATDIGCVADLGTGGCGFEQQLEVTLKALSPAAPNANVASFYSPPVFFGGTFGHGDGMNDGFLRPDSALAIILLTDEEDCSVPDYSIFYPMDPFYLGNPLNLRCSRFPDVLYSPQRYVDGFIQLRENAGLLIYAPIVGIPPDLATSGATYEAMLADPRMAETEDPAMDPPMRLLPSCDTANGTAYPPRRILSVAAGLRDRGASTTVQSICASSFGPAIDVIIQKIADALSGACLPRALNQAADGTVGCDVFELLPAPTSTIPVENTTCDGQALEFVGTESVERADGSTVVRELCRVPQVTPTDGAAGSARGWWYDNTSPTVIDTCSSNETAQRIAFSLLMPPTGAEVRLNCAQAILPESGTGGAQLGTFCDPGAASDICPGGIVPSMVPDLDFACDAVTRTCGVQCDSDAVCARAGLLSYVCDTRTVLEVVGGDMARVPPGMNASDPYNHCINPTCGE